MKHALSFLAFFLIATALFSPRICLGQATLRAGDTVDIRLSGVPTEEIAAFSSQQTIDEGGMLNIPYIGKIKIAGMDTAQVQQMIETKLVEGKIYTNPTITVTPLTSSRLVNVTGEVKSAGRLQYTSDLTVMSSIAGAGGFSDFADKKHVKLVRNGKTQVFDTTKFSDKPELDVRVMPGDQIYVPQAGFFN